MSKYKYFYIAFICCSLILLAIPIAFSASGTSKFIINQTTFNITPGKSVSEKFQLVLSSGTTWGTDIAVSPSVSGISITFNPSSGDPTFSGSFTISVSNNAKPGKYVFNVSATGDDPTTSPTSIIVYVSSPAISTTTTTTTTSTSSTTTTTTSTPTPVTTTTTTSTTKQGNYFVYVIAVLVILAIIIGGVLYYSKSANSVKYAVSSFSILSILISLYLIFFDSTLRSFASIHYYLLIIYTIILILINPLIYGKRLNIIYPIQAIISAIFFIGMLLDSLLGMPLSSIGDAGSSFSMNYFFGFGANSVSTFPISFSFSFLLILTFLILISSIIGIFKKNIK
ncbi:hypothetical protein Calag_0122 [Caldisphaera lagunensis DSM 15908]|uniref:Uncharacterized protein n=1 Tax=Caldisphaera lagunensis (strain DSM 15908 / JCM 11604 / ANMR 0165 / IC-154) TaxID=1056495 RepID=L0AA32_CALLD|nr:hypothetical protein [Caldisphaera lagunensis]AFZ69910.1 hypothetical protein Calag_0122 [Caldisphaera lagunensis DSM 15908]